MTFDYPRQGWWKSKRRIETATSPSGHLPSRSYQVRRRQSPISTSRKSLSAPGLRGLLQALDLQYRTAGNYRRSIQSVALDAFCSRRACAGDDRLGTGLVKCDGAIDPVGRVEADGRAYSQNTCSRMKKYYGTFSRRTSGVRFSS